MHYDPACMRVAIKAKVADVLVGHPVGLPVADIAKKAGIEQGKLARILRFLATKNCFREGAYSRNKFRRLLTFYVLHHWSC
jgi:hypothetical protein